MIKVQTTKKKIDSIIFVLFEFLYFEILEIFTHFSVNKI